jgi:hypothetical protein
MATLKTTIKTPSIVRTIVRGMGRPGEGGGSASPIPANTAPGNFTGAEAFATPQTKSQWSVWLSGATDIGARLGTIYDIPNDWVALHCADLEWHFATNEVRDNLRIALKAAETFSTSITGQFNTFAVSPPDSAGDFANFFFQSHSGPLVDNFGSVLISANPEEGIILQASQNGSPIAYAIIINPSGYEVEQPQAFRQAIGVNTGAIQLDLDGNGAVLPVGVIKGQLRVPYNCTITSWELVSNETGSIQIDIEKDTYANFPPTSADSIAGSARPTITASNKAQSSTLTGWTTALNEGDYIKVEVLSVSAITQATLTLRVTRV